MPPVARLSRVPDFDKPVKGGDKAVTLGGVAATQIPLQGVIARTLKALDADDGHLFGGAFSMKPQELAVALKDPKTAQKLAFDAIAKSGDTFLGDAFDPSYQEMKLKDVPKGEAEEAMLRILHHYIPRAERPLMFNESVKELTASLLKEPATRYVKASWDNTDDTDAVALVAINERTGAMRLLIGNNQP